MSGRYGFDPRSSWDTLNTGYSPNDQGEEVDSYPATELLAAIGLQTFRPAAHNGYYQFTPWEQPLPTIAARCAACGSVNPTGTRPYRFAVLSRGKFKNFSKATLTTKEPE
jgi:CRISPR-associated protein Csb3